MQKRFSAYFLNIITANLRELTDWKPTNVALNNDIQKLFSAIRGILSYVNQVVDIA